MLINFWFSMKLVIILVKKKFHSLSRLEWCEISNGQTIPKFANFWNFESFPN